MLFNSWVFFLFALVVYPAYAWLGHAGRKRLLLAASYLFYGWWDWRFLGLIWFSTLVDYVVARRLERTEDEGKRWRLLLVSLVVNLGLLGVFKYLGFFLENLEALTGSALGRGLEVVLPVGISFYTFQTLSYTVDVYRREQKAVRRLGDFALFVAFFPQLVAGPIERARDLLPQLSEPRRVQLEDLVVGAWLILWGFFTKLVIADNLAGYVDAVYAAPGQSSRLGVLLATYAFAFQIYGDFAGYSSIARGLARLLGVRLRVNFDRPYLARSPSEFWRRWHISLSSWLRDYLYIPLGGNRGSSLATHRNLLATMVLGGLWHGAAWNFVLWGAFHGALLVAFRLRRDAALPRAAFFHLVCLGWAFFRAPDLATLGALGHTLATGPWLSVTSVGMLPAVLLAGGGLLALEAWLANCDDPRTRPGWAWVGPWFCGGLLLVLWFLTPSTGTTFLYFQF